MFMVAETRKEKAPARTRVTAGGPDSGLLAQGRFQEGIAS
jgi:hypothetical protein